VSKISAYAAFSDVESDDLLLGVDVSDTTMAPTGTDKKMTLSQALAAGGLVGAAVYRMGAPSGGDDTAAFQAALAALPTMTIYATPPSGGSSATFHYGTIFLGSGTYQAGASEDIGNLGPFVSVIGPGHLACQIGYYGSGSCIEAHSTIKPTDDTFDDLEAFAGRLDGFTVDGTNATGSSPMGVDAGDLEGLVLGSDLWVQNFTQGSGLTGAKGVYLNNQIAWTENCYGRVVIRNCTNCLFLDVDGGDTSFEYNDLTFKVYAWPNQNGFVLNHGATASNGSIKMRGNFLVSATPQTGAAVVFGTSTGPNNRIAYSRLDIQAEVNGSGSYPHQTINFTSVYYSIAYCTGTMIFGGTWAPSNYNQQYPLSFIGVISGDSVLAGATQFNPATQPTFAGGVAASSLGIRLTSALFTTANSTGALGNEVFYYCRATAWYGGQITKLGAMVAVAGVTPGAGVNRMALFSVASTAELLAETGDMTSAFESTGYAEGTLGTAYDLVAGTDYFLVVLTSFTGTAPVLTRAALSVSALPPFAGTEYITGFSGGSQAAMPGSFTPSSETQAGSILCLYGR
jgi:hypothetical protein